MKRIERYRNNRRVVLVRRRVILTRQMVRDLIAALTALISIIVTIYRT